jgi:hypothetical protein
MAEVRKGDRDKTEERTGDRSFPMETAAQIRSAIKLRHRGKSKSAGAVLSQASAAISRLLRSGKITQETARQLRAMVDHARAMDRANK